MSLALLLGLQAAPPAAPAASAPLDVLPIAFDIAALGRRPAGLTWSNRCEASGGEVIVVCGTLGSGAAPLDMEALARLFEPKRRIVAEASLGGGVTGRTYVEAYPLDRGAVSNRAMIGIRLPF